MEKIEKEFKVMVQKKLANETKYGGQIAMRASDVLVDCMLAKTYNLARFVLEVCDDCDLTEILNSTIIQLTHHQETDSEILAWLFAKGATGKFYGLEIESAFSNWSVSTLRYYLEHCENDFEVLFEKSGCELWGAASAHKNAADYYKVLAEYGAEPNNTFLQLALAKYPEATDVIWLVEHGCDPDLETEESAWKDEAQSLIANLVCAYCNNSSSEKAKKYTAIEKLLEAGANPNAEIIPTELVLRYKGAKKLLDVATMAGEKKLAELLSGYGAVQTPSAEKYANYVRKMEEKLGLEHI